MSVKPLHIIYDGHCAFCMRALNIVSKLDVRGALSFHDSHHSETFEQFPMLQEADVNDAMYAISEGEPPHRGFYAFRRLLWTSPLTWALLPLFYFPGMSFLGTRAYAWVARNRTRFGCRSDSCSLPAKPRAKRV
jgi:predicted DCC family thiol-disulfide oxidoreductase YuxK